MWVQGAAPTAKYKLCVHAWQVQQRWVSSAGRWRSVQGRGMRQVHIFCFVREHVAAVEVGYAATSDIEPAAIAILLSLIHI